VRLEYQNGIIMKRVLGGKLHLAPFSKTNPPRRVLDVATGTGDWVVQMGDEYPTAYIEGIDLSPIQPENVPPNVGFYVQDA
jgi:metalloendopeptidase OMA1, mitochondrial